MTFTTTATSSTSNTMTSLPQSQYLFFTYSLAPHPPPLHARLAPPLSLALLPRTHRFLHRNILSPLLHPGPPFPLCLPCPPPAHHFLPLRLPDELLAPGASTGPPRREEDGTVRGGLVCDVARFVLGAAGAHRAAGVAQVAAFGVPADVGLVADGRGRGGGLLAKGAFVLVPVVAAHFFLFVGCEVRFLFLVFLGGAVILFRWACLALVMLVVEMRFPLFFFGVCLFGYVVWEMHCRNSYEKGKDSSARSYTRTF